MAKRYPQPPEVSEDELKRRHDRKMAMILGGITLFKYTVIALGSVGVVYVGVYLPVEASAGKTTIITVAEKFITDFNVHVVLGWGAAGAATLWGVRERRARHKEREEKDARITDLETKIDPGRTSSNINQQGDPKKGAKT